jgi:hypothetical protein
MKLLALIIPLLILAGCSNQTPRQTYRTSAALYNASSLALAVADRAGDIPPRAKDDVVAVQDEARAWILEASAWIQANPALADVPGVVPPSLDPMRIAVAKLRELARRYFVGLPPLVPMDVPATQPS